MQRLTSNNYLNLLQQIPILGIIILSFIYFAPCFYFDYNSDHSIQTLMSISFNFKRDFFYWGQNRLGSFLPMITYPLYKLTNVHPIYLISIVHYLLLCASCYLLSKFTTNYFIKLSIYCVVLFPVSDYRAIYFIGHPYSVQLFFGSLFVFTLYKIYWKAKDVSIEEREESNYFKYILYSVICAFSYSIGFWASELNAILILIPFFFVLFEWKFLIKSIKFRFVQVTVGVVLLVTALLLRVFFVMKNTFPKDETYDHPFFFDKAKIIQQFNFLKTRLVNLVTFGDNQPLDNFFYFLLFSVLLVYLFSHRKKMKNPLFTKLFSAVNITILIAFIMLFFSTWNLRSEYCPRYYTPIYFLFVITLLVSVNEKMNKIETTIIGIVIVSYSLYYNYNYLKDKPSEGAITKYNDFKNLPKGTLIAGYWDSYVIASVAYKNLIPIPFHDQFVRNDFMIKKAFRNSNFYFIKNKEFAKYGFGDTIMQHNFWLVYTGKKYDLNGQEVLLYKKL